MRFLTTITDDIPEHKLILADPGYLGRRCAIPEAMAPYQRLPHQELSPEQIEFNGILDRNRVLIENCFGRGKMLFRIIQDKFRGSGALLRFIIPMTIALINYHIKKHPLRRGPLQVSRVGIDDDEKLDEISRVDRL
jgi:hypothetical protein